MFARINSFGQRLGVSFMGDKANVSQRDQLVKDGRISKKSAQSTKGSGNGKASALVFSRAQKRQMLMAAPDKITTGIPVNGALNDVTKMEVCDSIETGTPSGRQSLVKTPSSTPNTGRTKRSIPGAVANIKKALTPESFGSTSDDEAGSEGSEDYSPVEVENLTRKEEATEEDHPHWSKAERDLFNKLNSRGFEPLLPKIWETEFPTMPPDLFSGDKDECFIKSIGGNMFKDACGEKALKLFLPLGVTVRSIVDLGGDPEPRMAKNIKQYIRWSLRDAGLDCLDYIPCLVVEARKSNEKDPTAVYQRTEEQLRELAEQYWQHVNVAPVQSIPSSPKENHRVAFNKASFPTPDVRIKAEPTSGAESQITTAPSTQTVDHGLPTLYGLIIAHTIVALVTLDTSVEGKELRNIALIDYSKKDQDVWNGLAIAMIAIWARNQLKTLDWVEKPPIELDTTDL